LEVVGAQVFNSMKTFLLVNPARQMAVTKEQTTPPKVLCGHQLEEAVAVVHALLIAANLLMNTIEEVEKYYFIRAVILQLIVLISVVDLWDTSCVEIVQMRIP
jgi:hypothetical protein